MLNPDVKCPKQPREKTLSGLAMVVCAIIISRWASIHAFCFMASIKAGSHPGPTDEALAELSDKPREESMIAVRARDFKDFLQKILSKLGIKETINNTPPKHFANTQETVDPTKRST